MPASNDIPAPAHTLKRGISKWPLVLMIINSIIGAGIFGLPSKIFQLTGVYSILAFFVCALIVLIFILCFAEVGSRFDTTGGPYVYTLNAFGKFPAFLMGWLLFLTRIFNYATLINLLVTYLSIFSPAATDPFIRAAIIIFITAALTWINHIGVKNIAMSSNILTAGKLLALGIFIIVGLFFLNADLFTVKQIPSLPSFSNAVLLLVFAFGGFESVMINTGEINNPSKTIPFGLLTATLVVAVFYILIQITCIGTLPSLAGSEKPLAEAASGFMGSAGGKFIALGAFVSILGTLNILMFSGSRLPYAFSNEDQFPKIFSRVHPKFYTPTWSLLLMTALAVIVSIAWSFLTALTVAVIIRVTVYLFVCASLIMLRKKKPEQTGYYKIPYGSVVALAGIVISIWLLSAAKLIELRNAAIFLSIGVIIYLLHRKFKKPITSHIPPGNQ
ncbi:MAG TPA: APC family permease [Ferruginibacter sp.]|nr:APC family permease [Ferruginibacter sp.]